jgi:hypothetical protein
MNTTAKDLITKSLDAGLTITLGLANISVRGFPALQPLADEIMYQRSEVTALLSQATKLLTEARTSGISIFAIGTNRVAASTALPADLRKQLRLAKIPLIAILRSGTPASTQAVCDLTGQPGALPLESGPRGAEALEYRVQNPQLPDDELYVSRALRLRWESKATPFGAAHWWRSFDTWETSRTQHCYYRVTPPVFVWYLMKWANLKARLQMLEWQIATGIAGEEGGCAERLATKQRIESDIEAARLPLLDMYSYIAARFPGCNFDAVIPELPKEPIDIVCPFELNPPSVATTPAWLDDGEGQMGFDLGSGELPAVAVVEIADRKGDAAHDEKVARKFVTINTGGSSASSECQFGSQRSAGLVD